MYLFDIPSLKRNYFEKAAALTKNPLHGIDQRLLDNPKPKLMILGSTLWSDYRAIMEFHQVVGIVDDTRANGNEKILGVPVLTTAQWAQQAQKDPNIISVICVNTPNAYHFFARMALAHDLPFVGLLDFLRYMDQQGTAGKIKRRCSLSLLYLLPFFKYTLQHAEQFGIVADSMDDHFSKVTCWSMLNYRLTGEPHFLWESSVGFNTERFATTSYEVNSQFYQPGENEVFVDGGGFQGGTTKQFARAVNGQFKHVYCYEPSSAAAAKIRENVRAMDFDYMQPVTERFTLIEKGLWSEEKTLKFNPVGFASTELPLGADLAAASHIIESDFTSYLYDDGRDHENCISVPVTSVDKTAADATFIKLEVEGSELHALEGAKNTIQKNKPGMCIGFYHKPSDWLELTKFVRDLDLGYKLAVRQHNNTVPDATVLYCYR